MSSDLILVVEDHPENRRLVERYLTAKGYRLVAAENAQEADALIAAERPGLVLVDFSLPGEDGMAWVRRLRSAGATDLCFVALTAHSLAADRDKALAAGCEDFITKPISLKVLLQAVASRLGPPRSGGTR